MIIIDIHQRDRVRLAKQMDRLSAIANKLGDDLLTNKDDKAVLRLLLLKDCWPQVLELWSIVGSSEDETIPDFVAD